MSALTTATPIKTIDAATVALVKTYGNDGKDTLARMTVVYRANLGGVSLADLATVTTRALVRAAHPEATAEQVDALATLPDFRVSKATLGQLLNAYTLILMSGVEPTPATAKAARTVFGQGGKAYSTMQTELRHVLQSAADSGNPFTELQFLELTGQAMADARAAHRGGKVEVVAPATEEVEVVSQPMASTRTSDTLASTVTTPPSAEGVVFALEQIAEGDWSPEEATRILAALTSTHATLSTLFAGLISA